MRVLGIDPGATTGWVVIESAPVLNLLASGIVRASTATGAFADADEADRATFRRLHRTWAEVVETHGVTHVALEQPVDAKPFWSAQKGQRREGTGTAFRSGVHYGLCVAALLALPGAEDLTIWSFPVHRYKRRVGWMPPKAVRANVLRVLAGVAWVAGTRRLDTDHEHMALGVALHAAGLAPRR